MSQGTLIHCSAGRVFVALVSGVPIAAGAIWLYQSDHLILAAIAGMFALFAAAGVGSAKRPMSSLLP